MGSLVDNAIALRVLYMLVKPFKETDAYKLGIIDDQGRNLIPTSRFKTQQQRDAYSYLHRLVFNLKKILIRLPGGDAKLKNIVAAYFLFKESYSDDAVDVNYDQLQHVVQMIDGGVVLVEEQLFVEQHLRMLLEDGGAPTNSGGSGIALGSEGEATGTVAGMSQPLEGGVIRRGVPDKKRKRFKEALK